MNGHRLRGSPRVLRVPVPRPAGTCWAGWQPLVGLQPPHLVLELIPAPPIPTSLCTSVFAPRCTTSLPPAGSRSQPQVWRFAQTPMETQWSCYQLYSKAKGEVAALTFSLGQTEAVGQAQAKHSPRTAAVPTLRPRTEKQHRAGCPRSVPLTAPGQNFAGLHPVVKGLTVPQVLQLPRDPSGCEISRSPAPP